jgi:hypothetical protein
MGRVLVDGDADVPAARALQEQFRLTPLSMWGKRGVVVPGSRDVYAPVKAGDDPLGPWKTLNAMLAENPPPEHHAVVPCARGSTVRGPWREDLGAGSLTGGNGTLQASAGDGHR